jgi:hypothetical protein
MELRADVELLMVERLGGMQVMVDRRAGSDRPGLDKAS